MSKVPLDVYSVIARTKTLDPEAFKMKVDANGMPAGFVSPDDSRRKAAYIKACEELLAQNTGNAGSGPQAIITNMAR